jgi:GNAT acetyltransferase-like protein
VVGGLIAEPAWLSLFNASAFHAHNGREDDALAIGYEEDGRLVGVLSGVLVDDRFVSGFSAPFGGPDFARPRETAERVRATLEHALAEVARAGAREVEVRCRPASWSANEALVQFTLLNAGFRVACAELSHAIDLRGVAGLDDYVGRLKSPARRALKHAESEPFALSEPASWRGPWALLEANRAARGWTLSLDLDYVEGLRAAFPRGLRMFELRHDGRPCAAALVFAVAPERWYVYAWGDAGHDLPRSPMNVLVARLVERALAEGVEVIDAGTTTTPAQPGAPRHVNASVAQFKQSVLARAELRPVLVR